MGQSATLLGGLQLNQTQATTLAHNDAFELDQLLEGTNAGDLIPEIMRLMSVQLLEHQDEWQLERRRFFKMATTAKNPEPEEVLELDYKEGTEKDAETLS